MTAQVVVSATDQVVVENQTSELLEVRDELGRPFIRIGPDGAFGDFASIAWQQSTQPEAGPAPAEPEGEARWTKVSDSPSWGWFEHRLHPTSVIPPSVQPGKTVELGRWQVPFVIGGRTHLLRGRLEYMRQAGSVVPEIVAASVPQGVQANAGPGRLPALFVDARGTVSGAAELLILGAEGEPMVRFQADGVEGNLASPTFAVTAGASRLTDGGLVGIDQEPRWKQIATAAAAGWLEPRGSTPSELGTDVLSSREPRVVHEWVVPYVLNGERGELRGINRWVPDPSLAGDDDGLPAWAPWAGAALAAVVLGGGAGAFFARRRR